MIAGRREPRRWRGARPGVAGRSQASGWLSLAALLPGPRKRSDSASFLLSAPVQVRPTSLSQGLTFFEYFPLEVWGYIMWWPKYFVMNNDQDATMGK